MKIANGSGLVLLRVCAVAMLVAAVSCGGGRRRRRSCYGFEVGPAYRLKSAVFSGDCRS
jgi:hypothetical protein